MNDTRKLKELAAKLGHTAVYESRTVSDADGTGSGSSIRNQRGWWMGQQYIGRNAEESVMNLDPINLGENF